MTEPLAPPPPLTSLSHGAGCGCKLPAAEVHRIAASLPRSADPDLLVGTSTADDAGVYRLSDELALVQTVDFFTPIVDDPFDFGRIAATNALSDVYAMGGTPITALNLVAFPLERLGRDVLRRILEGGAHAAGEAGVAIVGGHSIDDAEPKYGLAVTGTVHPDRLLRNSTARPGDGLYLSKPVGGGAVATAAKRGKASPELIARATAVMTTLNRDASAAALAAGASAMTDVTGYGLLGHAWELASASGVALELSASEVPAIEGVEELLGGDEPPIAGGTRANRAWVGDALAFDPGVPEHRRWLLCDAMTSGGLLIAAPGEDRRLADGPHDADADAALGARIGTVVAARPDRPAIRVSA